uniref:Mab-21-like nucleotidyltransferase domain-containing protein n=1 Tax=Magallana gigas TaxID=29159 RepID=A0A8W8HTU5_MAGGI
MNYEFSAKQWKKACAVVDDVLGIILSELKTQALELSNDLKIDARFIRQASARQGLKIVAPDEFDAIVPFELKGLDLQKEQLKDTDGTVLPGQMRLRVLNPSVLDERFPKLKERQVFTEDHETSLIKDQETCLIKDQETCLINTKMLQEKVFKSLMDKTLSITEDNLKRKGYNVTRGSRPPTMNIKISSNLPFPIDVDFVPGLNLGDEAVIIPDSVTTHQGSIRKNFPRFGLMKWVNKENLCNREQDKDVIWRICSSSYERYMFDLCLSNRKRRYIVTACRIMKVVVRTLREGQNHAANLLTSYHLKTIAMYCIELLTVPTVAPPDFHLGGVCEALGYFLKFLKLVFKTEVLPDFFLGNEYLGKIFPDSYFAEERGKYNLFDKENPAQVKDAKHCFSAMEKALDGCYTYENLNDAVIKCFENRVLRM